MECPQCGYVMDAFTQECPKCARAKANPAPPTAVATAPSLPPAIPLPKAPPEPPRQEREREVSRYAPDLGWPLTITLWAVIVLQVLFIGLVVTGNLSLFAFLPVAIRLVSAIALLRSKRWGFYVFGFISVGGLIMSLSSFEIWSMIVDIVPAVLIVIFALKEWEEFE